MEAPKPEVIVDPLGLEAIATQVLAGHHEAKVYCRMPQRDRSPGLATTRDMHFNTVLPGELTLKQMDGVYTLVLKPTDHKGIRRPISQNSLPEYTDKPAGDVYSALRLTFGGPEKAATLAGLNGYDTDGREVWTPVTGLYGEASFEKRTDPDADKFGQICLSRVMLDKVLNNPGRVGYDGAEPVSRGPVGSGAVALAGAGALSV